MNCYVQIAIKRYQTDVVVVCSVLLQSSDNPEHLLMVSLGVLCSDQLA